MTDLFIFVIKSLFPSFGFFNSVEEGVLIYWRSTQDRVFKPLPKVNIAFFQAVGPLPQATVRHTIYSYFERMRLQNKYKEFNDSKNVDKPVNCVHIESLLAFHLLSFFPDLKDRVEIEIRRVSKNGESLLRTIEISL